MKIRACLLLIIWGTLLLEPLSANFSSIKSVYSSCAKKTMAKSSCCKSKCGKPGKPEKKEKKDDCENNRCNPLMSCPTGNFYFCNYSALSIAAFIPAKQKTVLLNDNRIMKYVSECWHPPEII